MIEWHTFKEGLDVLLCIWGVLCILYYIVLAAIGTWNWIDDKPEEACLLSDSDEEPFILLVVPFIIGLALFSLYMMYFVYLTSIFIGVITLMAFSARFTRRIYKKLNKHMKDPDAHGRN